MLERYPNLKQRFKRIISKKRAASLKILNNLKQQGTLEATTAEIEALSENIVLTSTFWLNYAIISQMEPAEDVLVRGVYQVISLPAPYLQPAQREQLNALKNEYL